MNKNLIDQIVNRLVEHFIGPTMSQVHIPGIEQAQKFSRAEVNYRSSTDDQGCGNCQFFQPPNACEIVEGEIQASDVCDRWQETERYYVPISKADNETLVFPVGAFYRDGKQREFTTAQAEEMVRNFKDNILGRSNGWLPINREHERAKGRIGYITDMLLRDGAPYAKIEPVQGYEDELKTFDYISPEIRWQWTHPFTGMEHKNVLMGAAATNYPFLLGRTAIAKSLFLIDGEWYGLAKEGEAPDRVVRETFVHTATFSRISNHARIASGIVLQPDIPDAQGHIMRASEIEKACHRFAERFALDLQHERVVAPGEARVVESWIQKERVTWRFVADGEGSVTEVPAGTWCASVQFGEELWKDVLSGEISGFSPRGWGVLA